MDMYRIVGSKEHNGECLPIIKWAKDIDIQYYRDLYKSLGGKKIILLYPDGYEEIIDLKEKIESLFKKMASDYEELILCKEAASKLRMMHNASVRHGGSCITIVSDLECDGKPLEVKISYKFFDSAVFMMLKELDKRINQIIKIDEPQRG